MRYKVEWLNKIIKDKIDNLEVWDMVWAYQLMDKDTNKWLFYLNVWFVKNKWLDYDEVFDLLMTEQWQNIKD